MDSFVSDVKDALEVKLKRLYVTYNDCEAGDTPRIYYRGSNTVFTQNSDEILGPVWILYTVPVDVNYRWIQIMVTGV